MNSFIGIKLIFLSMDVLNRYIKNSIIYTTKLTILSIRIIR
jgi:hypothetical protein